MAGKGIQDLVGQVMIDKEFLADLVSDPARVLDVSTGTERPPFRGANLTRPLIEGVAPLPCRDTSGRAARRHWFTLFREMQAMPMLVFWS